MQSQLAFAKLWKCIVHEADHKHDVEQDEQAKDIIIRHLSDQHLSYTDDCDTAEELWKALKDAFTRTLQAKKLQLNREMSNLKMASHESVTQYIERAKSLRMQLKSAGMEVTNDQFVMYILTGLPKCFEGMITTLTSIDTYAEKEMSLDKMFAYVFAH